MYKEHFGDQSEDFTGTDHVEKEMAENAYLIKSFEDLNWKDPFPPPVAPKTPASNSRFGK